MLTYAAGTLLGVLVLYWLGSLLLSLSICALTIGPITRFLAFSVAQSQAAPASGKGVGTYATAMLPMPHPAINPAKSYLHAPSHTRPPRTEAEVSQVAAAYVACRTPPGKRFMRPFCASIENNS